MAANRRPPRALLVVLLIAAATAALPVLVLPRLARQEVSPLQLDRSAEGAAAISDTLSKVQGAIQPLEAQVEGGHIVPKFGAKAHSIISALINSTAAELTPAADGMLQALFLRQLVLLRQQMAAKFEKNSRPAEAVVQADTQFVAQAQELKRPGSDWSYDQERYALRAFLESGFRRDAALKEERQWAMEAQQSTVEIIARLQSQMEVLQQKVQSMRAGSPWFLSASYRVPGTPFQLIGRYQQGRGNVELSLSPDKDPANSEAGFVEGFGPANLGVNFNVGV